MKFFVVLVICGLTVAGYLFYPQTAAFLRNNGMLADSAPGKPTPPPVSPADAGPTAPAQPPQPAPEPVSEIDEITRLIPYPVIRPLEEITANWTTLPANAMPESVTLNAAHEFDLGNGNSMSLAAGRGVTPVSLEADGHLVVALRRGSSTVSKIPIDRTDLKEQVTRRYDEGVARIRAGIDERREAERTRVARTTSASPMVMAEAGEIPENPDDEQNYLEIMRRSVAAGDLDGETPDSVSSWRFLGFEEIDGTGYWTGGATIVRKTYFGDFEVEAKALIRDGRVARWIQPES